MTSFVSKILFKIVLRETSLDGMFYNLRSIALASDVNIVTSSGSRIENMSFLTTTTAAATLFPSFEPTVCTSILSCFDFLISATFV